MRSFRAAYQEYVLRQYLNKDLQKETRTFRRSQLPRKQTGERRNGRNLKSIVRDRDVSGYRNPRSTKFKQWMSQSRAPRFLGKGVRKRLTIKEQNGGSQGTIGYVLV